MDAYGKMAMISVSDFKENPEDIAMALTHVRSYGNQMLETSQTLGEFRNSIAKLPRMTTTFNRARRRGVAIMDDLLVQLRAGANQVSDVEKLFERMIKRTGMIRAWAKCVLNGGRAMAMPSRSPTPRQRQPRLEGAAWRGG